MAHGSAVDALAVSGREGRDRQLRELLHFRPLAIYLGIDLVPLVDPDIGGDFMDRLGALRIAIAGRTGFVFPGVALADDRAAPPQAYRIQVFDEVAGGGELLMGLWFATAPDGAYPSPPVGISGLDSLSGRPGVWIPAGAYDAALADGFVLRTPAQVLTDHLAHVVCRHAASLLGMEEAKLMLEALADSAPTLARDVVPRHLSLPVLAETLGLLVGKGVSIRDLPEVVERLLYQISQDPGATPSALAERLAANPPGTAFPELELPEPTAIPEAVIKAAVAPPPFVVELGPDLAASADPALKGDLLDGVGDMRGRSYRDLGLVLPRILFRQDAGLCEGEYTIAIRGRIVAQGIIWPDPETSSAERLLERIAGAGRDHAADLLDLEETRHLVDRARDVDPGLADAAEGAGALCELQAMLRAVLRAGGTLRDPAHLVRTFAARPLSQRAASAAAAPAPPLPALPPAVLDRVRRAGGSPDRHPAAHLASVALIECNQLISQLHDKEAAERFAEAIASVATLGPTAALQSDVAQASARLELGRLLLLTWEGRHLAGLEGAGRVLDAAGRLEASLQAAGRAAVNGVCAEVLAGLAKPRWAWPCLEAAEREIGDLVAATAAWPDEACAGLGWAVADLEVAALPTRLLKLRGELLLASGDGASAASCLDAAAHALRIRVEEGREDLHAPYVATLRALAEARMAAGLAADAGSVSQELHAARERLRTSRRDRGTRALRAIDSAEELPPLPEHPSLADLTLADLWVALELAALRAPLTVDHALRAVPFPGLHARLHAEGGDLSTLWRVLGRLARVQPAW